MSKHDDVDRVSTFFSISLIYLRMPVNVPVIADYFEEFVRDQIVPVLQQQTPFKKNERSFERSTHVGNLWQTLEDI